MNWIPSILRRGNHGDSPASLLDCLSLDLEVGRQDQRIHPFAAVAPGKGEILLFDDKNGSLDEALARLDELAEGKAFVLGHNLIHFDLPCLRAVSRQLRLPETPAVDTLMLNPLAFPQNTYHYLVKHYQDGQLRRGRINDPELDARLTLEVFENQQSALRDRDADLLTAWHWLTTVNGEEGSDIVFSTIRQSRRPSDRDASSAILARLEGSSCINGAQEILDDAGRYGWSLAYVLAWLSVADGNSVMPPWVRHQFPETGRLVRRLREQPCQDPGCGWCRERHDSQRELNRWLGFDEYRPEPTDDDGRSLQQSVVDGMMKSSSALAILPTGTGKSVWYQVPALSRYDKTGALTVVISPLVALMADQVLGLERKGVFSAETINGLLSMPERGDALDKVRLGDASMLIISPEQLRSVSVRRVLKQREIGYCTR